MATGCGPRYEEIALADSIAAWTAAVDGFSAWIAGALRRGATPVDLTLDWLRWLGTVSDRRRPVWASPHEVVLQAPVARLRDFSRSAAASDVAATLVLPPQAGHDSCIVDYSPTQSQMRTIIDAGLTRAYSLDWIGATDDTKDATINDYLDVIDRSVDHLGGTVN
ncbi:MAG: alpha/beta fold hydrolase, partial [Solirubrobacteraceae bacterium]